jgi:hypothetical protein
MGYQTSQSMAARSCKYAKKFQLFSTIIAPFDKKAVQRMCSTNNIERCVLKKIFNAKVPGSQGLILDNNTITVSYY